MLNPDTLLRAIEAYAEGSFEELFEYEWNSLDSFVKAAFDYIPSKADRIAFEADLKKALG